jgi:small-conductance mechanosensitive channel
MAIIPIGVSDASHVENVRMALMEIARKEPRIHKIINCRSQVLEDGGAVLSLRGWCYTENDAMNVQKDISDAIKQRFAERHIVFPD